MSDQRESTECCICMDAIDYTTNNCITPCGHAFCFQCLAKALEQNNTCPCCRSVLIKEPDEDEASEWSEWTDENEEEEEIYDVALTGFRMFNQRINGEEVEQDEEEESIEDVEDEHDQVSIVSEESEEGPLAEVEEITAKLQSRGITMLDLVAMLTDRKSTKVTKHTDRFMNALDNILDYAIIDCDREAKENYQREATVAQESKETA